jgi:perosamine synthetase
MDTAKLLHFLERGCTWRNGILRNKATGRRVSAILPVHILGHPVDMAPLVEAARRYDLKIIEDATESLGANYQDTAVGRLGDIACFSFNGNKLITTGGGGMIVTNNEEWARKAKHLTTQAKDDPLEYVHSEIGYNYRLTNIQAAMGVAQMEQLDDYIEAKRRIAEEYCYGLRGITGVTLMKEAPWAYSTFWLYTILLDEEEIGISSRDLMYVIGERKIQTRPLWQPIHLSQAHRGSYATDCSVAERLNRQALSLPCSVGLTSDAQKRVIQEITAILTVDDRL